MLPEVSSSSTRAGDVIITQFAARTALGEVQHGQRLDDARVAARTHSNVCDIMACKAKRAIMADSVVELPMFPAETLPHVRSTSGQQLVSPPLQPLTFGMNLQMLYQWTSVGDGYLAVEAFQAASPTPPLAAGPRL